MKENKVNNADVQGTETTKTKRNDSFSYMLKSLKGLVEKLERNEWATEEEIKELQKVHKKLIERYIGLELI